MIKKVLAYLKKNNVIYNRINDREYNIKFPGERVLKELTTKELLLNFIGEQREFNNSQIKFNENQREFNSKINNFIDNQTRFNNIQIKFNNKVDNFMTEQLKFNTEQLKFNNILLSLPTIKKEIKELKHISLVHFLFH